MHGCHNLIFDVTTSYLTVIFVVGLRLLFSEILHCFREVYLRDLL